jgi:hypothetical protein
MLSLQTDARIRPLELYRRCLLAADQLCRLHYTLRPMAVNHFALPCRVSPLHKVARVSQELLQLYS